MIYRSSMKNMKDKRYGLIFQDRVPHQTVTAIFAINAVSIQASERSECRNVFFLSVINIQDLSVLFLHKSCVLFLALA